MSGEITEFPSEREYDVLVSTGEQVTISLLSMCLQSMGYHARSYLGAQIPMLTDKAHARARIKSIADENIRGDLKKGTIVIVAGFQGTDGEGNITTLGRGGSDTSAVAVAAAVGPAGGGGSGGQPTAAKQERRCDPRPAHHRRSQQPGWRFRTL